MKTRLGLVFGATLGVTLLAAAAWAGEGGSSHVLPGATATLVDLPPSAPGTFFKPMYLNYDGSASVPTPTAAGIVADLNATVDTESPRVSRRLFCLSQAAMADSSSWR
jgi:hypothetical protein